MKFTAIKILLALLLSACSGGVQVPDDDAGRKVAAISLTPETAMIEVGQNQTFTATARDSSDNPINASFTWSSSNPQVASVTNGVATGLMEGTTAVTASSGDVTSNAATLTVSSDDTGDNEGDDDGDEPAPAVSDTIAYVRSSESGDEIRLINPDGSHDRPFWSTTQASFEGSFRITSLAWRPDSRELAFTSNHEMACSWYAYDIYAIRSDGAGLRRVSNAPACAGLVSFPKGRVTVGVQNHSFSSGLFQVYVQGATGLEQVSLGPGAGGTVTFEEVADFGEGIQPAVVILGGYRWLGGAVANVQPGQTVHAGTLTISGEGFWGMGADKVRWHPDGSRIGYVFAECAGLYQIPAEPGPGEVGAPLLDASGDDIPRCLIDWGPTPATSQQFLYATSGFDDRGIYLTTEGGGVGTNLMSLEVGSGHFIDDLKWLPDGSGFLFIMQTVPLEIVVNIYRYDFATGAVTQLTSFTDEFPRALSVSPDGQHVVFERSMGDRWEDDAAADLWIMRLDGSGLRRLVQHARAPAWSR